MNRKLITVIIVIVLGLIFTASLLIWFSQSQTNTNQPVSVAPSAKEKEYLFLYAKNSIEDFNTYSYNDFRPLLNVQGNATFELSQKIDQKISGLTSQAADKTYTITTTTTPLSTSLRDYSPTAATLTLDANVAETIKGNTASYIITAEIIVRKDETGWVIQSITINKR